MKSGIGILITAFILTVSCNEDNSSRLTRLKAEYEKLGREITGLEKEISGEMKAQGNIQAQKLPYIKLKKTGFTHYIEVQGRIDGEENVVATSQTVGVVIKVNVKEGDPVEKGQILAELDASVMLQTLTQLNQQLVFVNDLYERQKMLWEQKIGSEVQFLTAKNNKENLENQIKTIKEQIDLYKIVSPITGTVEDAPLKIGQSMAPGLVAFRIVNLSRVKIVSDVSEAYSGKIKKGDDVLIIFKDENKTIPAKIDFTSRYINPVNRTFKIESYLSNTNIPLKVNMFVLMNISDYKNSEAIVIPVSIIQEDNKSEYVWVSEKSGNNLQAKKRYITKGLEYNGNVEVLSGLAEDDIVIVSGLYDLKENTLIEL